MKNWNLFKKLFFFSTMLTFSLFAPAIDDVFFSRFETLVSSEKESIDVNVGLVFAKYFLSKLKKDSFSLDSRLNIIEKMIKVIVALGKENVIKGIDSVNTLTSAIIPNSNSLENFKAVQGYLLANILNLNKDDIFIELKSYVNTAEKEYSYKNLFVIEKKLSKNALALLKLFKTDVVPTTLFKDNNFYNFAKYMFSLNKYSFLVYNKFCFGRCHNFIFDQLEELNVCKEPVTERLKQNPVVISNAVLAHIADPLFLLYLTVFETQDRLINGGSETDLKLFKAKIEELVKFVFHQKVSRIKSFQRSITSFCKQNGVVIIGGFVFKSLYDFLVSIGKSVAVKRYYIMQAKRLIQQPIVPDNFIIPDGLKDEVYGIIEKIKGGGVLPYGGVLLYGAPGNGKTTIVNHIAKKAEISIMTIKPSDLSSDQCGWLNLYFTAIKQFVNSNGKVLLFFDDAEYLLTQRAETGSGSKEQLTIQMLSLIDGVIKSGHYENKIYLFAATNYVERMDPAAIRSERFGKLLSVDNPTVQEAKELCNKLLLGEISLDNDFNEFKENGFCSFSRSDLFCVCRAIKNRSIVCLTEALRKCLTEELKKLIDSKKKIDDKKT